MSANAASASRLTRNVLGRSLITFTGVGAVREGCAPMASTATAGEHEPPEEEWTSDGWPPDQPPELVKVVTSGKASHPHVPYLYIRDRHRYVGCRSRYI